MERNWRCLELGTELDSAVHMMLALQTDKIRELQDHGDLHWAPESHRGQALCGRVRFPEDVPERSLFEAEIKMLRWQGDIRIWSHEGYGTLNLSCKHRL